MTPEEIDILATKIANRLSSSIAPPAELQAWEAYAHAAYELEIQEDPWISSVVLSRSRRRGDRLVVQSVSRGKLVFNFKDKTITKVRKDCIEFVDWPVPFDDWTLGSLLWDHLART